MAKAIHWPEGFQDAVLAEQPDTVYCAIRPGTLYFDNHYWVDGEIVDIRVNHEKVRKGMIVGDLKCCAIGELSPAELEKHKPGIQTPAAILEHLNFRYPDGPFSLDSKITLVYYKPLAAE